jgi:FkbM family methyltransferase
MKIFFDLDNRVRRNILVHTDHGLMIVNRFDCNESGVGQGQWLLDHGSVASVEAWTCIQALLGKTDPVIIDIGSNIGNFMTWMARAYPNGKIYAIEPQRSVFQIMTGNAAINNFYNVYTFNCAMGAENTTQTFVEPDYFSRHDFGVFSLVQDKIADKSQNSHTVDIYRLDDWAQHFGVSKIDLIKIDAEGMDIDVLRGATITLDQQKPTIFIEHCDNQRSVQKEIQAFLEPWHYVFAVEGNNMLCTQYPIDLKQ